MSITRSHVICLAIGTVFAGAAYFAALGARAKGEARLAVWSAPAMMRIGKQDPAGSATAVTLAAARGEYAPFQVVVTAPAGGLTGIRLQVTDLEGPGGASIPASNLGIYREYYTAVRKSSQDLGGANRPLPPGDYADGLVPANDPQTGAPLDGSIKAFGVPVAAYTNQPFWIDVLVPRDAAAGTYTGAVTASSDQGSSDISISLRVWNFALPVKPSLHSSFGIYQPLTGSPQVQQELIRHRLMPFVVNQPGASDDGIERQALADVGVPLYTQANQKTCAISPPPTLDNMISQIDRTTQSAPGALVYVYLADEISHCNGLFPALKQWSQTVHAGGAAVLLTAMPIPELQDDGSGTGRSVADIWVLLPKQFAAMGANLTAVRSKGDQVWSYTALVQDSYSPKWLLDFLPINFRIFGAISQSLELKGILYWSVNYWSPNPWDNPDYSESGYNFPGEGSLVYPGWPVGVDGVVPSMRMKWLRQGVEDYEYVEILKSLGRGDWALDLVRTVGTDWRRWTQDWRELEQVRLQLGDEISRLSSTSDQQ